MFEEYPKHLYTTPGPHVGNDGVTFGFIIVNDSEEEQAARAAGWKDFADAIAPKEQAARAAGWKDFADAIAPKEQAPLDPKPPQDAPPADDDTRDPTRAELEAKAKELGIEFSPRIGDVKLGERIQAALDAQTKAPEA